MAPKPPDGSTRTQPNSGNFQGVSPVLLSSPFTVLVNNLGIPDSGLLAYPFRKAIVVEEIRWDLYADFAGSDKVNLGGLVYTKMQLGRHLLMRDAVPLWLLGTTLSDYQEQGDADAILTTPRAYSHYRWRLPKPLYIEAGEVLRSQFNRANDGFGTITGQVSYVGKTVAPNQPVPSVIAVPYAAPFVTTVGNVYQQSNEKDLFNPFDVPLKIQRMNGRVMQFASGARAESVAALTPVTPQSDVTILMNDSWGGKMVNNNTGPSDIFDAARASWLTDTVMPGKGVYEARIWNIPADYQIHIAMIGHREEAR